MHFDGPVVVWLILALIPVVIPAILAASLKLFFGRTGCIPLALTLALGIGLAFAVTFYLNSLGTVVRGEVIGKKEMVLYYADGSWDYSLTSRISYRPSDTAMPVISEISVLPSRFDEMNRGDFVDLRIPSPSATIKITRLDDQKVLPQVLHWLSGQPFLLFFTFGLIVLLSMRFLYQTSLPVLLFVSALLLVGAWWFANIGGPIWRSSSTLLGSMNSASATIREVRPLPSRDGIIGWFTAKLFASTELVLLDTVPPGRIDPVLTVDEIDLGSVALRPGQILNIEYSASDPRVAYLADASRTFVWTNALIGSFLALLLLGGIAWIAHFFASDPAQKVFPKTFSAARRRTKAGQSRRG